MNQSIHYDERIFPIGYGPERDMANVTVLALGGVEPPAPLTGADRAELAAPAA
jgi:hypothetical protein